MIVARRDARPRSLDVRPHARLLRARRGAVRRERARPRARRGRGPAQRRPRGVPRAVGQQAAPRLLRRDPRDGHVRGADRRTARARGRARTRSQGGRPPRPTSRALAPIEHLIDGLVYRTVDDRDARERRARSQRRARRLHAEPQPPLRAGHLARAGAGRRSRARRREGARLEFTDLSPAAMPSASHPLVKKLVDAGVARRRAEAGVDRRGALRLARDRRRQLRAGRERAGAPEERVDRSLSALPGLRKSSRAGSGRSRLRAASFDNRFSNRSLLTVDGSGLPVSLRRS